MMLVKQHPCQTDADPGQLHSSRHSGWHPPPRHFQGGPGPLARGGWWRVIRTLKVNPLSTLGLDVRRFSGRLSSQTGIVACRPAGASPCQWSVSLHLLADAGATEARALPHSLRESSLVPPVRTNATAATLLALALPLPVRTTDATAATGRALQMCFRLRAGRCYCRLSKALHQGAGCFFFLDGLVV
jgi:hypothetical protein